MVFACCSPAIPPDSQVALTLKIVSGFGVNEIARAYLAKEEAVAKIWGGNTLRVLRAAEAFAENERQRERTRATRPKAATQ